MWVLLIFVGIAVFGGLGIAWRQGAFAPQSVVQETAQETVQLTKAGDVATIGVYIRDISQNNIDTKVATALYCVDNDGVMVIDGTTSSTTAETTGKTSMGKEVCCYAIHASYQTKEPTCVIVDEEWEHVVVDSFKVADDMKLQFYNDQLDTGKNVTAPADTTGTFDKLRLTNNESSGNGWLAVGGIYIDTVSNSNVTDIDFSGSASLYGADHASTRFVDSSLATDVSSRKEKFNYVFETDDNGGQLILEEQDYVESGSVQITSNGDGCSGDSDVLSPYVFSKGYYRMTLGTGIGFGHENDASSASVIGSDLTGAETPNCVA